MNVFRSRSLPWEVGRLTISIWLMRRLRYRELRNFWRSQSYKWQSQDLNSAFWLQSRCSYPLSVLTALSLLNSFQGGIHESSSEKVPNLLESQLNNTSTSGTWRFEAGLVTVIWVGLSVASLFFWGGGGRWGKQEMVSEESWIKWDLPILSCSRYQSCHKLW